MFDGRGKFSNNKTPFVEAVDEALDCSFHSFRIAHATMMEAATNGVIKSHRSKVEVITTRVIRGGRYSLNQNLETLLNTPSNDERLGLGYMIRSGFKKKRRKKFGKARDEGV